MARKLVPYGLLPNGNYGISLNDAVTPELAVGDPLAAALEVLETLPSVADPDNTPGRLVFSITDSTIFVYINSPTTQWVALEGVPATIGNTYMATGKPEVTGSQIPGELFWTLDTEVLFVWDGLQWQAAGGRYATDIIEVPHVGNDVITTFTAGISTTVPAQYIEVFIDGVRQASLTTMPGIGDYSVVGTNVVFVVPPVLGADILIRSMQTAQVVQNTNITETVTIAAPLQGTFGTGVTGTDPNGVMVSVDGAVKVQNVDYTISKQDTTIVSISKLSAGAILATVTTAAPHFITTTGTTVVTIAGVEPADGYNDSFVVSNIISPNIFDITVPGSTAQNATADPLLGSIMFFDPPFEEDKVIFTVPFVIGGEEVYIRSFKNIIVAPSQGEANTISSLNAVQDNSLIPTSSKVGVALQVKGLVAGANINILDDTLENNLVITASTGANFENRAGWNGPLITPGDVTSYVGVLDTNIAGAPIVVDLGGSGPGGGTPTPGRKITIKDEGGLSGSLRNIHISGPVGATFGGASGPYIISADRGSVTLVLDSSNNWNIVVDYDGTRSFSGTGSPEGFVAAPTGSSYINIIGGPGITLYIKESGSGNTGWVAK